MNDLEKYRPSGRMCNSCIRKHVNCSNLKFSEMRRLKIDNDGISVVICSSFKKEVSHDHS